MCWSQPRQSTWLFPAEATNENDTTLSVIRATRQAVVLTCQILPVSAVSGWDKAQMRRPEDLPRKSMRQEEALAPMLGATGALVLAGKEEW